MKVPKWMTDQTLEDRVQYGIDVVQRIADRAKTHRAPLIGDLGYLNWLLKQFTGLEVLQAYSDGGGGYYFEGDLDKVKNQPVMVVFKPE